MYLVMVFFADWDYIIHAIVVPVSIYVVNDNILLRLAYITHLSHLLQTLFSVLV